MFGNICSNMIVMPRCTNKAVIYAPMYIHSFQLVQPHTIVEAENSISDTLTNPKLTTSQINLGGIVTEEDCSSVMIKISKLFSVPVMELLDEYNSFIYNGQGKQIKQMRQKRNMTQKEFAAHLGVLYQNLKKWELNKVQMSKSLWKILMERG